MSFLTLADNPPPMELLMYIGNDLIESMPVNFTRLSEPGYLGRFKRILKQKHWELIQQSGREPEYLVVNMATQMAGPSNHPGDYQQQARA